MPFASSHMSFACSRMSCACPYVLSACPCMSRACPHVPCMPAPMHMSMHFHTCVPSIRRVLTAHINFDMWHSGFLNALHFAIHHVFHEKVLTSFQHLNNRCNARRQQPFNHQGSH
jgi:hypothetical protein